MKRRIAVIGSSNVDLVTHIPRMPEPGETLAALSFETGPGGKGANQAVAAAKLGADVLFMTRVGDDAFGDGLLAGYRAAGIDIPLAHAVRGTPTGAATILVEPSGENRILIAAGANATLSPNDVDAAADALASCGLLLLQLEIPLETVYRAIDWAAGADVAVLLNPAPAHLDLDVARLAGVTFLAPNQNELALLSGLPVGSRVEAEAAAKTLVAHGVPTLIVTLGADGALVVDAQGTLHVPAPKVEPVDTTGAGDAFIGAFAARWVATRDVAQSVEQAVCYAADSTTRAGAQASYARRANFDEFPSRS